MVNTFVNILSISSIIIMVAAMFLKKHSHILFTNAIANFISIAIYFLLGRFAASAIVIVGFTRTLLFAIMSKKNIRKQWWLPLIFDVIFIASLILSWQDPYDLIILTNYMMMTHAFSQRNVMVLKSGYIISSLLLITYNAIIGAYVIILKYSLQLTTAIIGLFLILKQQKQQHINKEQKSEDALKNPSQNEELIVETNTSLGSNDDH